MILDLRHCFPIPFRNSDFLTVFMTTVKLYTLNSERNYGSLASSVKINYCMKQLSTYFYQHLRQLLKISFLTILLISFQFYIRLTDKTYVYKNLPEPQTVTINIQNVVRNKAGVDIIM